jgi:hypothetical protein
MPRSTAATRAGRCSTWTAGDRREHRDPVAQRRLDRDRLLDGVERGVARSSDQLKEFGETRRGWLGVRIQDVTPDVAEAMGLADAKGALVTDVPDGPAKDAGIKSGDVITRFGTNDVSDAGDLTRRVADAPIGEAVPVIVLREGRTETLAVTLGRREDAEAKTMPASSPAPDAPKEMETLGLTLAPLDDDMRARLGLDPSAGGLMIMKVDQTSEAFTKGLVEGDLITEAGQQPRSCGCRTWKTGSRRPRSRAQVDPAAWSGAAAIRASWRCPSNKAGGSISYLAVGPLAAKFLQPEI